MKILVLSTTDIIKAAHSRPHQMVSHLSTKHKVDVFCTNAWWLSKNGKPFYHHEYNQNVEVSYFSGAGVGPISQERNASSMFGHGLEGGLANYDVIVDFDSLIVGDSAARFAKRNELPIVFDMDDDLPAMIRSSPNVPFPLRIVAGPISRRYTKRLSKVADKVTVTLASLAEKYGVPAGRMVLIPNGVDTDSFRPKDNDIRARMSVGNDFVIGYVGVLREWVDLSVVFKAIRTLENVKFLVVGEEGALEENKRMARELGVEDKVIFAGTVPYEKVPDYVSAMDACVIPFKTSPVTHQAVPLKLFEYLACEKPVISSNLRGVKELVGSRIDYYEDIDSLRGVVLGLMKKETDSRTRNANRIWVEQTYGWSRLCDMFEETLVSLVER